jgi:hypothetical protein
MASAASFWLPPRGPGPPEIRSAELVETACSANATSWAE